MNSEFAVTVLQNESSLVWYSFGLNTCWDKVLKLGKYGDLNVVLLITSENNILQLVMQNDIAVSDI